MTEEMSDAALERWALLPAPLQRAHVQVFADEVACYAAVLATVHASIRAVNSALKGYEGVSEAVAELVSALAQGAVPRDWLHPRVELACENLALWLADLQSRLDFLYDWAVEGPPPAMPLGLLSRPRSFLTAVQQAFAEVMSRPVGQVTLEAVVLADDEEVLLPRQRLHMLGQAVLAATQCVATDGSTRSLAATLHEGVLVGGMVLQGAKWDSRKRCLADPPRGVLHSALPLLWLRATTSPAVPQLARALALPGATLPVRLLDSYVCPIFKYVAGFGARNPLLLADADDCLTSVLLPCGAKRPEVWAAQQVGILAVPDPAALLDAAGGEGLMRSLQNSAPQSTSGEAAGRAPSPAKEQEGGGNKEGRRGDGEAW
ncbi:hypothetical protein GPECTOR_25g459 [Gonium pectorale]|uniref:Dynein heavy chain C-terminal domain-containing protein n=1 Tax=Gonium pectorale TaxID=33097 RepID=A0A150GGD5_GONPE|nr:hypothetical protein GPECTOR_25g459 [Gonium pectorale]|eukprot:KXZ48874.1 hypothetical protein GPECTOR_25g459 [Gonium pectorale]